MDVPNTDTSNDRDLESRYDSQAAVVDGKLFLYRGVRQSYDSGKDKVNFPTHFEVFDAKVLQWRGVATQGTSSSAYTGVSITSIGSKLYLYGGYDGTTFNNKLFEIDTLCMHWNELIVQNPADGPMRKAFCGLVSLPGDVLCLFGGKGIPRDGGFQDGSVFCPDPSAKDGRGWTNEMHCFHVQRGMCIHRHHSSWKQHY